MKRCYMRADTTTESIYLWSPDGPARVISIVESLQVTDRRYIEFRRRGRVLDGVVMAYGSRAKIGARLYETFDAGAFGGGIEQRDVTVNLLHRADRLLARTGGGGLALRDTPQELRYEIDLPLTRDADDALALIDRGIIRGSSIEFIAREETYQHDLRRVLTKADLEAFGLVDRPAYPGSQKVSKFAISGRGLAGEVFYNRTRIVADRGTRRKSRIKPGAFDFALQDESREMLADGGRRQSGQPLASTPGWNAAVERTPPPGCSSRSPSCRWSPTRRISGSC